MTRALALLVAFGAGAVFGVIVGLSLVYNQPEPPPPFREPYDGEALGT